MRVLGVDPGEKRIGLAISDPTGTISRPLVVFAHKARSVDALRIVEIALKEGAGLIVVGQALDSDGEIGHAARKSQRLAEAIRKETDLTVQMWDESGTTQDAIQSRISMGVSRKKRKGHLDDLAASIMLQDFLINHENTVRDGEGVDGKST